MYIWTFGSLDVDEKFVRKTEAKNGNCCVYQKIKPRTLDIVRNAVRCWEKMSEFVTFSDREVVIKVVQ